MRGWNGRSGQPPPPEKVAARKEVADARARMGRIKARAAVFRQHYGE